MINYVSSLFNYFYGQNLINTPTHLQNVIKNLDDWHKKYHIDIWEPSGAIVEKMQKFKILFAAQYEQDLKVLYDKLYNEPEAYNDRDLIEAFFKAISHGSSPGSMEQYDNIYIFRSNVILAHLYNNEKNMNKNLVFSLNYR